MLLSVRMCEPHPLFFLSFFFQIEGTYVRREEAINRCLAATEGRIGQLRAKGDRPATREAQVTVMGGHALLGNMFK